jgi:Ran GTPase-activating protein (RanGAP) involved in mRNA processing and transport
MGRSSSAPGLLQYHPDLHLWGSLGALKRIPYLVLHGATNIEIRALHTSDACVEGIDEILKHSNRLQKLTLSNGVINGDNAARLFGALSTRESSSKASGLRSLRFQGKYLDIEIMSELSAYLANTSSLEELVLSSCTFKQGSLNGLATGMIKNRSVKTLNLSRSELNYDAEVALSKILRGCPTLRTLNLSTCSQLSWRQLETITNAILDSNCNLQELDIGNIGLNDGVGALAPAIAKLQKLDVCNNTVWCAGINALGKAIGASNTITDINLSNNRGLDSEVELKKFSLNITSNKSLQVLDLSGCRIGTPGLQHLKGALVGKTALRELHLYENCINDAGCQYVAEILVGCPALEVLHLGWNSIGSAGVRTLAAALPQARNLQQFIIDWCWVVDDASTAALFSAIHDHPSLTKVDITASECGFLIGELAKPKLEALKPGLVRKY